MTSLLLIALLGAALAHLNRGAGTAEAVASVIPEDLWADFEAVTGLGRASLVARTTVGGLPVGAAGWVARTAACEDATGELWLDAAAVVHVERTPDRVLVRRDPSGYHLQRHARTEAAQTTPSRSATRARVRVDSLFD